MEIEQCIILDNRETDPVLKIIYEKVFSAYIKDLDAETFDLVSTHDDIHSLKEIGRSATVVNSFFIKSTHQAGYDTQYFERHGSLVFQNGKEITSKKDIDFKNPLCSIHFYRYERSSGLPSHPHRWRYLPQRYAVSTFKSIKFIKVQPNKIDSEHGYFIRLTAEKRLPQKGLVYDYGETKSIVYPIMRCGYPKPHGKISSLTPLSYDCDDHFLSRSSVQGNKNISPKRQMDFELLQNTLPDQLEIELSSSFNPEATIF